MPECTQCPGLSVYTGTPDFPVRKEDLEVRWRGRSSVLMVSVVEEILVTGFPSSYFRS